MKQIPANQTNIFDIMAKKALSGRYEYKPHNETFRQIWDKAISDENKAQNFRKNHCVECKVDIK